MMPRFRRYRVFLIFAAIITLLLIKLTKRNDWPQYPQAANLDLLTPGGKEEAYVPAKPASKKPQWTPRPQVEEGLVEPEKPTKQQTTAIAAPKTSSRSATKAVEEGTKSAKAPTPTSTPSIPKVVLPERKKPPPGVDTYPGVTYETDVDDIHPISPPGRQELVDLPAVSSTIHWQKQVEHFPVPTGEIIKLPTGKPVSIPKIQYAFEDETSDAKRTREKRQVRVKEEFKKAWEGYKTYAWLHDELSPVSAKFRDPFCGWAATLVDTLDTLWIMGLEDEFEEAVKGVEMIDFTTSPRSDIPMFETTIRYLGGLLAAYDVSGGKYKTLLNKAVELAEVLIGAFDTPNRMPVLYYRWKPAFASQPHRASQRSNLAELGSLSLEFTRLAQLTHDQKYYDAVARVTNALEEWQDRGTRLGSVFPENVDASGCNRTVELTQPIAPTVLTPSQEEEKVLGYQPSSPETVPEPRKKGVKESPSGPGSLQFQVTPGEPGKGHIKDWDASHGDEKKEMKKTVKRTPPPPPDGPINPVSGMPMTAPDLEAMQNSKQLFPAEWDCKPQGLEPADNQAYASTKFGMGGGQDSTYEYYPKQFLLLGGLEDQYRKMYLKTIEDIKKWMIYRPMIPDNRDILFSGSVMTKGDPINDLELIPEVEHLTCFIGGMIGMSAKIFKLEGDLELAKKLTDGCVWAYESTPHGIMPEGSIVVPCKDKEHCTWNETMYYHELDPIWDSRDQNVADYIKSKKEVDAQLEANAKAAAAKKEAQRINALNGDVDADEELEDISPSGNGTAALKKDEPVSLQKRQTESSPKLEVPKPITHNFKDGTTDGKKPSENTKTTKIAPKPGSSTKIPSPADKFYEEKAELTETDLRNIATGGRLDDFPPDEVVPTPMRDPSMPFTHREFVESRIKQEELPPGFTHIKSRKYILRPEAIESVWYMHRITGDSTWADKGWSMFENIINSTSTPYGHSAIFDVTAQRNQTYQMDEMESFWLAETLKYFYLLYSTPDVISLDEWVLNTEAHPFKRPS